MYKAFHQHKHQKGNPKRHGKTPSQRWNYENRPKKRVPKPNQTTPKIIRLPDPKADSEDDSSKEAAVFRWKGNHWQYV